jgi:Na+-translocating ferredoxin:NAD+ oxidoreductase subunit G
MNRHPILIAALLLALFGVLGTSLVAFTHEQTRERILANERQALLRSLQALVPAAEVDNDMADDSILVHAPELLGSPETRVYRGRKDGEPVAAVFTSVAPNGYSGPIRLLVGVRRDGTLAGVRVVAHKETPGLGDKIDERKSDWVLAFRGRSLGDPPPERWKVRRDGGDFDQFTGATITPRAVVKAVRRTLEFAQREGAALYAPAPATDGA